MLIRSKLCLVQLKAVSSVQTLASYVNKREGLCRILRPLTPFNRLTSLRWLPGWREPHKRIFELLCRAHLERRDATDRVRLFTASLREICLGCGIFTLLDHLNLPHVKQKCVAFDIAYTQCSFTHTHRHE